MQLGVELEEEGVGVTDEEGTAGVCAYFLCKGQAGILKAELALVQVGVGPHFEAGVVEPRGF